MRVHVARLIEAAPENADADPGLKDQIERRGDGAKEGLAAASRGPDDAVDRRALRCEASEPATPLKERVREVIER